jgi:hypothetical protein
MNSLTPIDATDVDGIVKGVDSGAPGSPASARVTRTAGTTRASSSRQQLIDPSTRLAEGGGALEWRTGLEVEC